ncbi:helix-turn-helix domain-containing protein, partial [Kitasatospora sp. NPDC001574]
MARRKNAMPSAAPHYELAQWLRALRAESGLTYRQMAGRITRSGCSSATLSRADSGSALPRLGVVEAYAAACGASVREARQRWERARGRSPPLVGAGRPRSGVARAALVRR